MIGSGQFRRIATERPPLCQNRAIRFLYNPSSSVRSRDEFKVRNNMSKNSLRSKFMMFVLLGLIAVLAACGGKDDLKKGTTDAVQVPPQYDLTILADKDGQFEWQGATLTAEDLRGHIRYQIEIAQPIKTILLKRGEKQKVTNSHVAVLAGIARDLKTQAFVEDNDGRLKVIQIAD